MSDVKETIAAIRESTRNLWNKKTLHGIPKNLNKMHKYRQVIVMQDNLSQGHKTVRHEDCHSPLYQHFEQKAKNQANGIN